MSFQFETFSAFLWMEGHGPYVWASYGATIFVMVALYVICAVRKKSHLKNMQRQIRLDQQKAQAKKSKPSEVTE